MSTMKFRLLPAIGLCLLALAVLGCPPASTEYKGAETRKGPTVDKKAIPASEFNKFFPPEKEGEWTRTFDQEKGGTAVAMLKKGGTPVANLSVFDALSNPKVIEEFKESTEKVDDKYPVRHTGQTTSILVADRISIKVANEGEAPDHLKLNKEERIAWLKKFDLAGLAGLVK